MAGSGRRYAPEFKARMAELDVEADSINEDIPNFAALYPILNLGFSFGF